MTIRPSTSDVGNDNTAFHLCHQVMTIRPSTSMSGIDNRPFYVWRMLLRQYALPPLTSADDNRTSHVWCQLLTIRHVCRVSSDGWASCFTTPKWTSSWWRRARTLRTKRSTSSSACSSTMWPTRRTLGPTWIVLWKTSPWGQHRT